MRHLLAKDILRFHCVYWPAMLLGAGYEPPRQLFVHGWLLLDDRKISKSLGNVVDPLDLIDIYGVDPVRFWCARAISFGQDGTASLEGIHERYDRELGNDLGNLLSRTTAMVARYRDGSCALCPRRTAQSPPRSRRSRPTWPSASTTSTSLEPWSGSGRWSARSTARSRARRRGSSRRTTRSRTSSTECSTTSSTGSASVAIVLAAYVPDTAAAILEALGQPPELDWSRAVYGVTGETEGIEAASPLFPRLELPTA